MEFWNKRHFKFTELTKELAYLLGVYFGDGSILRKPRTRVGAYFTVSAIDRDFIRAVKAAAVKIFPDLADKRICTRTGLTHQKNLVYCFKFGCVDFCKWMLEVTRNKHCVPTFIPKISCAETKAFCEGYLDSEGWVFKKKVSWANGRYHFEAGVGSTDPVIKDIVSLLKLQGVQHGKWCTPKTRIGTTFYRCTLNMSSLYYSNIHFRIRRKQENIYSYARERDLQRLYAGAKRLYKRGKTQSDLCSNVQSTAEMSVPLITNQA